MNKSMSSSRIPYFAAVNGVRWDPITGCTNTDDICAVRARGLCWAEGLAKCSLEVCPITDPQETTCEGCESRFRPTFHPDRLDAPLRTRTRKVIAVGFGGDMFCDPFIVNYDLQRVFRVMYECESRGHVFVSLTKCPSNWKMLPALSGAWWGVSICTADDLDRLYYMRGDAPYPRGVYSAHVPDACHTWVSFEPVMGGMGRADNMVRMFRQARLEWCAIGGLSDGAGRIVPPEEGGTQAAWVQPIIDAAHEAGCGIFLKNLSKAVLRQLRNPRTGKAFESMNEMRHIPQDWRMAR